MRVSPSIHRIIDQSLRGLRTLALLGLTLGLAGCSLIETAYNQAPQLLYWWLDRQVDLTEAHRGPVKEALQDLSRWHRRQELPQWQALAQRLSSQMGPEISPAQACAAQAEGLESLRRFARQSALPLGQLASSLSPAQLSYLQQRLAKNDVDWRKEWLDGSAEKRLQNRVKRGLERSEDLYGRLSRAQVAHLEQLVGQSAYQAEIAWAERQRRQQDLLQTLERARGQSPEFAQKEVAAWIERALASPVPEHRTHAEQSTLGVCRAIAGLHNETTPEQREHAAGRLREYARAFGRLAQGS
jgi:hypothetical protein